MKNNKGFSTVELVTTFALTLVIVTILLNLVIVLKELYINNGVKNSILTKQAIISEKLSFDMRNFEVSSYSCNATNNSCTINFGNGTIKILSVTNGNIINYGDESFKLQDGIKVGNVSITPFQANTTDVTNYDTFIKIKIELSSDLIGGSYDIQVIYQTNHSDITI
jgi:hypothetical protein